MKVARPIKRGMRFTRNVVMAKNPKASWSGKRAATYTSLEPQLIKFPKILVPLSLQPTLCAWRLRRLKDVSTHRAAHSLEVSPHDFCRRNIVVARRENCIQRGRNFHSVDSVALNTRRKRQNSPASLGVPMEEASKLVGHASINTNGTTLCTKNGARHERY